MAKVYHSEIFGLREAKYDWLNKHNINNVDWNKLEPHSEFYLFTPHNTSKVKEYNNYKTLSNIFTLNSSGIKTHRDNFVVAFSKEELKSRFQLLKQKHIDVDILMKQFDLTNNRDWNFSQAHKIYIADTKWEEKIITYQYRPFDNRKIFYAEYMIDWPRIEIMKNMLNENICLTAGRQGQVVGKSLWNLAFLSDRIFDTNIYYRGGAVSFPLYLYPETEKKDLFSEHESGKRNPNIKRELFDELKNNFKKSVTPEEIFYYIYGILYSNIYRKKYEEFLKIDFPSNSIHKKL